MDIAGLVKGASKGQGLGNQFLASISLVMCVRLRVLSLLSRLSFSCRCEVGCRGFSPLDLPDIRSVSAILHLVRCFEGTDFP
jgi:ribosome-binding ATPase YchF (GTP1/OBG family)